MALVEEDLAFDERKKNTSNVIEKKSTSRSQHQKEKVVSKFEAKRLKTKPKKSEKDLESLTFEEETPQTEKISREVLKDILKKPQKKKTKGKVLKNFLQVRASLSKTK